MSHSRRQSMSTSFAGNGGSWITPPSPVNPPTADSEAWREAWANVYARDLIDSRIASVDEETSVEDACHILLSEDITCLAIKSGSPDIHGSFYAGLFDFSDVNAFLTLAATRRALESDTKANEIIAAARAGHVPVRLVSNFSQKNPLEIVPHDATVLSLLELFARGIHRALVSSSSSDCFVGMVSDRGLLTWFASYAKETPSLLNFISNSLHFLSMPSLYISADVVAASSAAMVLDAMRLMSEEGVSSVAVLEEESGRLLSAVSVTDIGKIVVPSESKQILYTPLHQFVSRIKEPYGSKDGAEKYPVFSVSPSSRLSYTIEKLLATNAHRLFVTSESRPASPLAPSHSVSNLSGIVSIVDILSIFARLAQITDVDPTRMQRHRRASSSSSQSSAKFEREVSRSDSPGATGLRRNASFVLPPAIPGSPFAENVRSYGRASKGRIS